MKVLIADIPEADAAIRSCLPGRELAFVRTLQEAIAALRRGLEHCGALARAAGAAGGGLRPS